MKGTPEGVAMVTSATQPARSDLFGLKIDIDAVSRVGTALAQGDGDLSECLAPDLKKVADLLAHILVIEDIAPGVLADILSELAPHYIKRLKSETYAKAIEKRSEKCGAAKEWRAVMDAKNHPAKKDYLQSLIAWDMKMRGVSQAESIKACAEQLNKDADSIRRAVTRSKKRKL